MCDKLHLVYATDRGFLMPTKVSAASAIAHASHPEQLVIDILDCGFDNDDWNDLVRSLRQLGPSEMRRHVIDMTRFMGFKAYRGNLGVYARLDIPEIITDADWCVYADGDTLFLDDPLELAKHFDNNYALLGHKDLGGSEEQVTWYARNGFQWSPHDYVCAGFILMNLKWMRENEIAPKSLAFLGAHTDTPLNDQDVLNILCQDKRALLPFEWGVFNIESFQEGLLPKCIHYAFGKPWNLSAKWTRCLLDVDRLWFRAAKKYCGIGLGAAGTTWWQYAKRWQRSVCHRIFLSLVCLTGMGRRRWGSRWRYYSPVPLRDLEGRYGTR